jgi:hypothetical protein
MTKRLSVFLFNKTVKPKRLVQNAIKIERWFSHREKPGANQPVKYDFQRLGMDLRVRTDLSAVNNELPRPISIRFEYGNCFQEDRSRGVNQLYNPL